MSGVYYIENTVNELHTNISGGNQMTNEELIEKMTEWLLETTREYEFEYWSGAQEEGVKFHGFKTKEDMIDDLKTFLNTH